MKLRRSTSRSLAALRTVLVYCAVTCLLALVLVAPTPTKTTRAASQASPPRLLTRPNTNRAIALESVTLVTEPFPLTQTIQFGSDNRTRILLFGENLGLLPGEGAGAVTAEAEDVNRIKIPVSCRTR